MKLWLWLMMGIRWSPVEWSYPEIQHEDHVQWPWEVLFFHWQCQCMSVPKQFPDSFFFLMGTLGTPAGNLHVFAVTMVWFPVKMVSSTNQRNLLVAIFLARPGEAWWNEPSILDYVEVIWSFLTWEYPYFLFSEFPWNRLWKNQPAIGNPPVLGHPHIRAVQFTYVKIDTEVPLVDALWLFNVANW